MKSRKPADCFTIFSVIDLSKRSWFSKEKNKESIISNHSDFEKAIEFARCWRDVDSINRKVAISCRRGDGDTMGVLFHNI